MADLSDIPDEAVMDAAKDGYARWVGAEDWQALVRKIGTRDAAAAAQIIRPALAAALPFLDTAKSEEMADLIAEIRQKDGELEEWRTGTRRLSDFEFARRAASLRGGQ